MGNKFERVMGMIIMLVAGAFSAICLITSIIYLTPLPKDMPVGARIFAFVNTAGMGVGLFFLARAGYRLRRNARIKAEFELEKSMQLEQNISKAPSKINNSICLFSMWEQSIHYCDGWFLYKDGKGGCSVITQKQARAKELSYTVYQASQDINRGGLPDDVAYRCRQVRIVENEQGRFVGYELTRPYCVDKIPGTPNEIKDTLVIPKQIGPFFINQVCDDAFEGCTDIKNVILPDSIVSIGRGAFLGCVNLRKVNIPESVRKIGEKAFEGTLVINSNEPVVINGKTLIMANKDISGKYVVPKNVKVIAEKAFENCTAISEIVVHDEVMDIGDRAFAGCSSLKSISLPKKVAKLGAGAFEGCSSLTNVAVPEGVTILNHFAKCTSLVSVAIPNSVTRITNDCFKDTSMMKAFLESNQEILVMSGWLISYKVPVTGELNVSEGIVGIADQDGFGHSYYRNAATYSRLTKVKLPDSLLYLGMDVFAYTGLKEVTLPNNLLLIEKDAFRSTQIENIIIPKSVKSIQNWAFMGCKALETITFEGETDPVWPAITSRGNDKYITIIAPENSPAHKYVQGYGEKEKILYKRL